MFLSLGFRTFLKLLAGQKKSCSSENLICKKKSWGLLDLRKNLQIVRRENLYLEKSLSEIP